MSTAVAVAKKAKRAASKKAESTNAAPKAKRGEGHRVSTRLYQNTANLFSYPPLILINFEFIVQVL
jgi:hypothetical protein